MATNASPGTFYTANRDEWRKWLQKNWEKEKEIWLVFPKESSGKPRMTYNEATEEALCFGWIDSVQKPLDADHTMMRYSPRRPKTGYSQLNKERLALLMRENKVHPSLQASVQHVLDEGFLFPDDIRQALQKDPVVWKNFQGFPEAYQRLRIASVEVMRKQPEEFNKRLANLIEKTRKNKMITVAGMDAYY